MYEPSRFYGRQNCKLETQSSEEVGHGPQARSSATFKFVFFFAFRIGPNTSALSFLQFWLPYRFPVQKSKDFLIVILLFYSFFVFVFRGPLGRILFIVIGFTLLK